MKYYKRGFLNSGEGMAAFESNVEYDTEYAGASIDANFKISDCNRQVSLDFYCYNDNDYEGAMFKLDTLAAELKEFGKKLKAANQQRIKAKASNEQA